MTPVVALFIGMLCISSIVFQVILFRSTWLEAYIEVNIRNEVFVKMLKVVLLLIILFSIFCTVVYLLVIAMGIILSGRY